MRKKFIISTLIFLILTSVISSASSWEEYKKVRENSEENKILSGYEMQQKELDEMTNKIKSEQNIKDKQNSDSITISRKDLIFITINGGEYWITKHELYLSIGLFSLILIVIFILYLNIINEKEKKKSLIGDKKEIVNNQNHYLSCIKNLTTIPKVLSIISILIAITVLVPSLMCLLKIYFVCYSKNGQMYDGLDYPYSNGNPSNPYTIYGYIGLIISFLLISIGRNKLIRK